jgi:hypothetical protein
MTRTRCTGAVGAGAEGIGVPCVCRFRAITAEVTP